MARTRFRLRPASPPPRSERRKYWKIMENHYFSLFFSNFRNLGGVRISSRATKCVILELSTRPRKRERITLSLRFLRRPFTAENLNCLYLGNADELGHRVLFEWKFWKIMENLDFCRFFAVWEVYVSRRELQNASFQSSQVVLGSENGSI